ncbi:hypothetical protein [Flavobacterium anhuiense]|uniref:hypothetical protein n=1 Tax=Flavobacterium anhuiense TaxID=459526 RepID=UPI0034D966C1
MNAEIKINFKTIPNDLQNILISAFPSNITLTNIISNSIYQNHPIYHDCFIHGVQSTDAILLFQIVGTELIIHIEIRFSDNVFVTLKQKINSYHRNILNCLKNNDIEVKNLKSEAIIIAEGSYLFTGHITSKNQEFLKQLDKDKFRLLILPVTLFLMTILAYKLGWINRLENIIISLISQFTAILLWYLIDYFFIKNKSEFKFQNINE